MYHISWNGSGSLDLPVRVTLYAKQVHVAMFVNLFLICRPRFIGNRPAPISIRSNTVAYCPGSTVCYGCCILGMSEKLAFSSLLRT